MAAAIRQLGKRVAQAPKPKCPPQLEYLWRWYCDLAAARQNYGMGPCRLTSSDIIDGTWLFHRTTPTPWEARVLRRIDDAVLTTLASVKSDASTAPPPPRGAGKRR